MAYVYKITNLINGKKYVGITKNLRARWNSHKHFSRSRTTYLYNAMNKYGVEFFRISALSECTWEQACALEKQLIATEEYSYNIAVGGEGGYVVPNEKKEEWKSKLSSARKGRKPALGMSHTEENKKLFAEVSKKYWSTQDTYTAEKVIALTFKEAHTKYGISKTHYYRLKRSLFSEQ